MLLNRQSKTMGAMGTMDKIRNRASIRSQRAFTFTEILVVLGVIGGVTVGILAQAGTTVDASAVDQTVKDINSIVAGITSARSFNTDLNVVLDFNYLKDKGLLPDHLHDYIQSGSRKHQLGANANPFGGIYSLSKGPNGFFVVGVGLGRIQDNDERLKVFRRLDDIYKPDLRCASDLFASPGCATSVAWRTTSRYWAIPFQ